MSDTESEAEEEAMEESSGEEGESAEEGSECEGSESDEDDDSSSSGAESDLGDEDDDRQPARKTRPARPSQVGDTARGRDPERLRRSPDRVITVVLHCICLLVVAHYRSGSLSTARPVRPLMSLTFLVALVD
jgi:hypothetical protein